MTTSPSVDRWWVGVVFAIVMVATGPICVFGTVETAEHPIVQCGGPAVQLMRHAERMAPALRERCRTDVSDQVWGGVCSFGVGLALLVVSARHLGWFRRPAHRIRPPAPGDRFTFHQPLSGSDRGVAVLDQELLRLEHPSFTHGYRVNVPDIAAVVRHPESDVDPAAFRRHVDRLDLCSAGFTPNLAVVVSRHRRVDVVGVTLDDPDALAGALVARGVEEDRSLDVALRRVAGERPPPVATAGRDADQLLGVAGGLWAITLTVVVGRGLSGGAALGLVASSAAWGAVAFRLVVGPRRVTVPPGPVRSDPAAVDLAILGAGVAILLLAAVAAVGLVSGLGAPRMVGASLLVGAPTGGLVGTGLRGRRGW